MTVKTTNKKKKSQNKKIKAFRIFFGPRTPIRSQKQAIQLFTLNPRAFLLPSIGLLFGKGNIPLRYTLHCHWTIGLSVVTYLHDRFTIIETRESRRRPRPTTGDSQSLRYDRALSNVDASEMSFSYGDGGLRDE